MNPNTFIRRNRILSASARFRSEGSSTECASQDLGVALRDGFQYINRVESLLLLISTSATTLRSLPAQQLLSSLRTSSLRIFQRNDYSLQRHPLLDQPGRSRECPLQRLGCPLPLPDRCQSQQQPERHHSVETDPTQQGGSGGQA